MLVWSPLAGGFLAGRQRRGDTPPSDSRRAALGDTGTLDLEQGFNIIDALEQIATEREVSIAQVSLNWVLRRPGVTSALVGARTIEQLEENLGAASWTLTDNEVARGPPPPLPAPTAVNTPDDMLSGREAIAARHRVRSSNPGSLPTAVPIPRAAPHALPRPCPPDTPPVAIP